jgi:putative spermidine/putrescine transport system substrate-binding protein
MQRRSFLITLGSLAIGSGLTGCQNTSQFILRVRGLKKSLPPQLAGGFTKSIQPTPKLELATESQIADILEALREWKKTGKAQSKGLKIPFFPASSSPAYIPNLVSLGDTWLATAIEEKLIEPIAVDRLKNWDKLDKKWQELGRRDDRGNLSTSGQIWGVPYRWGTTVIMYRRDRLQAAGIQPPTDWSDLWNPKLKQKISVLDLAREVIGIGLKKLGQPYNSADISQVSNLKTELQQLHQQVKFYSSDNYLQPLIMGDTWVAVGWSSDVRDILIKYPNIGVTIPRSGSAIWADMWVQPATNNNADRANNLQLAQQWIDYCLQVQSATQISLFTTGSSPIFTNLPPDRVPSDVQTNPLITPDRAILDRSEFLYPLSAKNKDFYPDLWQQIRRIRVT